MKTRRILIKYRIVIAMVLLLVPVSAVFAGMAGTATKKIESQVAAANQSGLQLYHNIFQNELLSTENFMNRLVYTSGDFHDFSQLSSRNQVVRGVIALADVLDRELSGNPDVAAYVIYHSPTGQLKSQFNSIAGYTDARAEIEALALDKIAEGDTALGWYFAKGQSRTFLCRMMEHRGSYVLAFLDLDQAVKNYALLYGQEGELIFYNSGGVLANERFVRQTGVQPDYSREDDYYFAGSGQRYMLVWQQLANMKMAAAVPYDRDGGFIRMLYMSPYIYCLAAVLALTAAIVYLRRTLFLPLEDLVGTMEKIQEGDLSARLKSQGGAEFTRVQSTFNTMVDELSRLRIQSYEQQLEIARGKLNFLRMQIRPHFYLNCLKSIFGLAQSGSMEAIQQAVLYLSSHLRYVFDVRNEAIPLEKELEMCENYINLQRECQCGRPEITITADSAAARVPVPTVSLLTIVENCVKHGMAQDGTLNIQITAKVLHIDAQQLVDIIVRDNGPGFDTGALEILGGDDESLRKLGGIGIGNIIERFKLMYGERCSVRFYNKNGACVEFLFEIRGDCNDTVDRG